MARKKPNTKTLFNEGPIFCPFCRGKIVMFVLLLPKTWQASCGHCGTSLVITASPPSE